MLQLALRSDWVRDRECGDWRHIPQNGRMADDGRLATTAPSRIWSAVSVYIQMTAVGGLTGGSRYPLAGCQEPSAGRKMTAAGRDIGAVDT